MERETRAGYVSSTDLWQVALCAFKLLGLIGVPWWVVFLPYEVSFFVFLAIRIAKKG